MIEWSFNPFIPHNLVFIKPLNNLRQIIILPSPMAIVKLVRYMTDFYRSTALPTFIATETSPPFSPPTCCRNQNRISCRYIHYPSIPREMGRQWQDELMAWYECIWKSLMGRTDYWKRDKNVAPVERDIFGDREWNGNRRFSGLTELRRRKRVRNRVKSWLKPIVGLFIAQETRNVWERSWLFSCNCRHRLVLQWITLVTVQNTWHMH